MEPMSLAWDDEDNPFAYQPPSTLRGPSTTQNLPLPYFTQRGPTNIHSTPSHCRGLSSIPFTPPTSLEPTYEDYYQDMTVPLNDFNNNEYEPEDPIYLTDGISENRDSELILSSPRVASQFTSFQQILAPVFLRGGCPSSTIAVSPKPNTTSSEEITLPIPTQNDVWSPEDAWRANHASFTSIYASSPSGSLRGFPLNDLVRSRESSPHRLALTSRNIPTPDAIHSTILTPRKELLPQARVQARLSSSDIYKSRLLAYATTVADHMSGSGDEGSTPQHITKHIQPLETERAASSPVIRNASSLGLSDENSLSSQLEGPGSYGRSSGDPETLRLYMNVLDPNNWMKPKLAKSPATGRLDHSIAGIHTASPGSGISNSDRIGDELDQTDLDDDLDLVDTYLEDWENGSQSEATVDDFEDRPLVSEYEAMQVECGALAANEPSDDENGPTGQHRVTTSQQDPEIEHSVLDAEKETSAVPVTPRRNPKVQPFPMNVSRRSAATSPKKLQPTLTRLSPKFVSQPSRHVRQSPVVASLRKRFKDHMNAVKSKDDQGYATALEDGDDEIESWSG
ncbi:hypothetical protein OPQ81_005960 [Rhizoctonia solani]|nr:hypothetical protein OPQ81_005960 [Rhizoctonia solani]